MPTVHQTNADEKWVKVTEEVYRRSPVYAKDTDDANDLAQEVLEHLVKVNQRAPQLNILDKDHYRARIITNAIIDWLEKRKVHRTHYQRLVARNSETGEEYETALGDEVGVDFDDEQLAAIEKRDRAEVAERVVRKMIGRSGARVLDAVKRLDSLRPNELAYDLKTRPATITSQIYAIRQKGKQLEI